MAHLPGIISAGSHNLEMIGYNTFGVAGMGCEVYDNTPQKLLRLLPTATSTGLFLKDYIGMPVMLGSGGLGFFMSNRVCAQACASHMNV